MAPCCSLFSFGQPRHCFREAATGASFGYGNIGSLDRKVHLPPERVAVVEVTAVPAEAGTLGAARDPRDRFGGDENSAKLVEWGFSIVGGTRKLLD